LYINSAYMQSCSTAVQEDSKDLSKKRKDSSGCSSSGSKSKKEELPSVGYSKLVSWWKTPRPL